VGEGDQINIWEDPWIPTSRTRKVFTPKGNIVIDKVADLINPLTGLWDEELIREVFWSVDANRILEIPIAPNGMQDFVAWHLNKIGLFTIRSAYPAEWDYQLGRHHPNVMDIGKSQGGHIWKNIVETAASSKIKKIQVESFTWAHSLSRSIGK
jgi:hypothetical protein